MDESGSKGIRRIYEVHYKKLLIIPFLILLLAIGQIVFQTATTGDFMHKDVNLKGGIVLEIQRSYDTLALEKHLISSFPGNDVSVRASQEKLVVASDIKPENINLLVSAVEEKLGKLDSEEYSKRVMGERLGASFFKETFIAVLIAFAFMGFVVFIYFKTFVPSAAVILAAVSNIIVTLAIVNLLGIKIGMAGIAAFLMLIGYSVDTDILLSTRVLKRKEGTVVQRVYGAMKTGLTMNFTTLAAVTVALIFIFSLDIKQVMTVVLIGLLVDMINTWIQNAGILRWYLEKKNKMQP